MFSQRELAPAEDQGVVFGVVQASANSTLDQTKLFMSEVYDVYHSIPESESIFQITDPNGGFWCMVTKSWSHRKKNPHPLLLVATRSFSHNPGLTRITPPPPPPPTT